MPKLITFFTPTYNRAHTLSRCYTSLCSQKLFNFVWLIVDDGSTDHTKELVDNWKEENNRFDIQYVYKENGGLHTAYNTALELVNTELFVCLESDDFFSSDAAEIITKLWDKAKNKGCIGIITLCKDTEGKLMGDRFPDTLETTSYWKHRRIAKGDKQYVFKTEALKRVFPMKGYPGEKFFDPKYRFFALDEIGPFLVSNEAFDYGDYLDGGLTSTVFYHYYNSPNSFADYRKMYMQLPECSFSYILKQNIHYVSSCCLAGKLSKAIKESPRKGYTILGFIPGMMLACYIRFVNRQRKRM